ncbi:zinc ribbon domain-containing protein [Actinomadura adrarensis]|uniref:Zinc ribbon domain-containing protein n=1 Tax=Actinomadura adrarensis TaxID=1819600 RepID=A0ABW3CP41_9ACTN
MFLTILTHKAESAGRELIAVNPANTSRTCARCGHIAKENRLTQAVFRCTACGHTAHADVNAVTNILRAGLALRNAAEAVVSVLRSRRVHVSDEARSRILGCTDLEQLDRWISRAGIVANVDELFG